MKKFFHRCTAAFLVFCAGSAFVPAYGAPPLAEASPWLETHRVASAPARAEKSPESPNSMGRWYAGLHVGPMFVPDSEVEGSGLDMDVSFDSNFAGGFDIGYRHNTGLRLELELTFRNSDADSLDIKTDPGIGAFLGVGSLSGATITNADGGVHSWSLMLNGWLDLDFLTAPIPALRNWAPGPVYRSIPAGWTSPSSRRRTPFRPGRRAPGLLTSIKTGWCFPSTTDISARLST
jgi:hypothetical protein